MVLRYSKGKPAPHRLRHSRGVPSLCPGAGKAYPKEFDTFEEAEAAFMEDEEAVVMDYVEYDVSGSRAVRRANKSVVFYEASASVCEPPPVPNASSKTFSEDLETISGMQDSVEPTKDGPVNVTVWKGVGRHEDWVLWAGIALGAVGAFMVVVQVKKWMRPTRRPRAQVVYSSRDNVYLDGRR